MKRVSAFILFLSVVLGQIYPLWAVEDLYKLSEVYTPAKREVEEKRKVCFFPFRNKSSDNKRDANISNPGVPGGTSIIASDAYLSRGIPAILVTEVRKMGMVYDENVIIDVMRHQMGKKSNQDKRKKNSGVRDLEGGGLDTKQKRKLEYTEEEWRDILSGKTELVPARDPRYIPIEVQFYRDEKNPPLAEEAFRLGHKNKCFYVVTGEYEKNGEDSLISKYELTFLWDGQKKTGSLKTGFIRAFQEMKPLTAKLRKDLVKKDFATIEIDTGSRPGALVFLDDVYIGKTPIRKFPTTQGRHEILVTEKDFQEIRDEVFLKKNSTIRKSYKLKPFPKEAYLSVTSDPPGAEVFLGIEKIGETPIQKAKVRVGKNRLRVSKEDHIDYFTGVDLKEGFNHKHKVVLREGDSTVYYKNKNYVFLDYTYKDFSVYSLYGTLLFYAGHIYYQMRANQIYDSSKGPEAGFNALAAVSFAEGNPTLGNQLLLANELNIINTVNKGNQYQRIAGDLGLQRQNSQAQFRTGPMLYGMFFMIATSFTFLFLGLDEETYDIGFHPGSRTPLPLGDLSTGEARGHFLYKFRF